MTKILNLFGSAFKFYCACHAPQLEVDWYKCVRELERGILEINSDEWNFMKDIVNVLHCFTKSRWISLPTRPVFQW